MRRSFISFLKIWERRFRLDKGQALLEFALITPMLIMLLVGIISFGLYINANVSLQQAVRVGARAASVGDSLGNSGDNASTQATPTVWGVVNQQLNQSVGLNNGTQKVTMSCLSGGTSTSTTTTCPAGANNFVSVTVTDVYNPILPIPGLLPSSITMQQTYTMMME